MIDTKMRLRAKGLGWRVSAIVTLAVVAFLVTGSFKSSGVIVLLYQGIQIVWRRIYKYLWARSDWAQVKGLAVQMTGLPGSGKSTIAQLAAERLKERGYDVAVIDADYYRTTICKDLGFTKKDRLENIRRLGKIARTLADNGTIAIIAAINPYEESRHELKKQLISLVYVKCDLEKVKERDPKGLYKRAMLPYDDPNRIWNFTGISDPFERPTRTDLVINTDKKSPQESARELEAYILGYL